MYGAKSSYIAAEQLCTPGNSTHINSYLSSYIKVSIAIKQSFTAMSISDTVTGLIACKAGNSNLKRQQRSLTRMPLSMLPCATFISCSRAKLKLLCPQKKYPALLLELYNKETAIKRAIKQLKKLTAHQALPQECTQRVILTQNFGKGGGQNLSNRLIQTSEQQCNSVN